MPESLDDLAAGRTDPVQLVERAMARARASDAVFITLMDEAALEEAHAARRRWKEGRPLGRHDGIPIAWKDLFDVAGTRTSAGSRTRDEAPPAAVDAPVVAATRHLGFIAIGKTNLGEFAFSGLGANPHFGTPTADLPGREPRMPGGSSCGSAVGTDTAGSVRVPAAFTGCVGYKASQARYDMAGVFPLARSLDSIGPLAGCVAEARSVRATVIVDRERFSAVPVCSGDPRSGLVAARGRLLGRRERRRTRAVEEVLFQECERPHMLYALSCELPEDVARARIWEEDEACRCESARATPGGVRELRPGRLRRGGGARP